nr:MAG: hypothetical protein [Cymbidium ringspot virus satellite RNA]
MVVMRPKVSPVLEQLELLSVFRHTVFVELVMSLDVTNQLC